MVKGIRVYAIVSQCLIQMFLLMFLGYKLGTDWWLKDGTWGAVLCVIGALMGLVLMVSTIMKVGGSFDKRKDIQ